jgi:hypothetical protein
MAGQIPRSSERVWEPTDHRAGGGMPPDQREGRVARLFVHLPLVEVQLQILRRGQGSRRLYRVFA